MTPEEAEQEAKFRRRLTMAMVVCGVPENLHDGFQRYIVDGIQPGSFMSALLANDYMEACRCADSITGHSLFKIARFLYNHAPMNSFGSPEAFKRWLEVGGLKGKPDQKESHADPGAI